MYCITIDCDSNKDCASLGISLHCVPLKRNPELAKDFVIGGTHTHVRVVTVPTKPVIGELIT